MWGPVFVLHAPSRSLAVPGLSVRWRCRFGVPAVAVPSVASQTLAPRSSEGVKVTPSGAMALSAVGNLGTSPLSLWVPRADASPTFERSMGSSHDPSRGSSGKRRDLKGRTLLAPLGILFALRRSRAPGGHFRVRCQAAAAEAGEGVALEDSAYRAAAGLQRVLYTSDSDHVSQSPRV